MGGDKGNYSVILWHRAVCGEDGESRAEGLRGTEYKTLMDKRCLEGISASATGATGNGGLLECSTVMHTTFDRSA